MFVRVHVTRSELSELLGAERAHRIKFTITPFFIVNSWVGRTENAATFLHRRKINHKSLEKIICSAPRQLLSLTVARGLRRAAPAIHPLATTSKHPARYVDISD
jgi:hypothetical protein